MNIKTLILSLAIFAVSCSSPNKTPAPTISAQDQKLLDLTVSLQESLRNLRCNNPQGWDEAKEKSLKLILSIQENDPHLLQANQFLAQLKELERTTNIKICRALVTKLDSDVIDFEQTLPHPHNNIHDRARFEKKVINPFHRVR